MSGIDHKAEAIRIAGISEKFAPEALVHATLYAAEQTAALVEQQRVANLLAAAALVPDKAKRLSNLSDVEGWAEDSDAEIHSALADGSTWCALLGAEVAQKRGLAW